MKKAIEINEFLAKIANEKNVLVESIEQSINSLNSERKTIENNYNDKKSGYLNNISLEEVINCITNYRPQVIIVRKKEPRIVIVRPHNMREYGFLLWSKYKTGTRWQMKINCDAFESPEYSVLCACCDSEKYGEKAPEDITLYKDWEKEVRIAFRDKIVSLCKKHGISTLFMRHAERWEEKYKDKSINAIEADEYGKIISRRYGPEAIKESLRFIRSI